MMQVSVHCAPEGSTSHTYDQASRGYSVQAVRTVTGAHYIYAASVRHNRRVKQPVRTPTVADLMDACRTMVESVAEAAGSPTLVLHYSRKGHLRTEWVFDDAGLEE